VKLSEGLNSQSGFRPRRTRALLITVHYESVDGVVALLTSVQRVREYADLHVLLADNSSGERYLGKIRSAIAEASNVELVECGKNLGYFGAARLSLECYLAQRHELPDWVIVCNHDVVIQDRDFFSKLFAYDPNSVGVIASRIQIRENGVDQNPFMRRRPGKFRWWMYLFAKSSYGVAVIWDWMGRVKKALKSSRPRNPFAGRGSDRKSEPIYAAHGSFLIFSRRYFEAGGYLDENLFLYGEEISVAEICRSLNLPILYEPSLLVLHDEHQSTGKVISRTSYQRERDALQWVTSRYLRDSREFVATKSDLIK
jgi:GT2 family glycosyltransferase